MKKLIFMSTILTLLIISCVSTTATKTVNTRDFGVYNPSNVSEDQLCTIIIDQYVIINQFNEDKVNWNITFTEKTVNIPSGVHTFHVHYVSRQGMSASTTPVIGQLEKGNTYLIKGTLVGQRIQYKIVLFNDRQEGEDVSLNVNRLQGNDASALSNFIKYVLNPTMDGVENTVKLENDNFILLFEPDMVYTLTNKLNRDTIIGRRGFSMDFRMTEGKLFLLEINVKQMSRQQFLASNYQENAQIILVPINCTENEVVFKYERPIGQQGNIIRFTITKIN